MKNFILATLFLIICTNCSSKPNIVFILTDDLDWTLGTANIGLQKTHELITADGNGITFKNMFANTPICCPSRSTIWSGLYQHNTECWANGVDTGCGS